MALWLKMSLPKIFIVLLTAFLTLSNDAKASELKNIIECNYCSPEKYSTLANKWAVNNITQAEAEQGITKTVHVIDLSKTRAASFEVSRQFVQLSALQTAQYLSISTPTATPSSIAQKLEELRGVVSNLKSASDRVTIPGDIIGNPWEFVNCSYCTNHVASHLKKSLSSSTFSSISSMLSELTQAFDLIQTNVLYLYRFELQNGGSIVADLNINSNSHEPRIGITEVVDEEGNGVPFSANALKNLAIYLSSKANGASINEVVNNFNFYVPNNQTGRVYIRDCTGSDAPECN